jgi:predicted phosphohydrolase
MGLEVQKAMPRPVSLILVMPTQPAESLQERSGITAFEEEKVNAKVYAHIDGGSPDQKISLIRGTTALDGIETGVRFHSQAMSGKDWSQTFD